jgi:hypothetical protein
MRTEAKAMDSIAGERASETARAFEQIAEQFERVVEAREGKDQP